MNLLVINTLKKMTTKLIILIVGIVLFHTYSGKIFGDSNFSNAINKSNQFLENVSKDSIIPGIVAGVSINGTQVWAHAVGHTDIENDVVTRVDSVWRLGSISKSIASLLIGQLIDEGRLDLNKSVHNYLKSEVFPKKKWNNKTVDITLGQVMSHTAGLRVSDLPNDLYKKLVINNVTETVEQFKDEPLLHSPDTGFNYSNYGFQIVGAVIESVMNQTYESTANNFFNKLGLISTFCERREQIIPHRARYYIKVAQNNTVKILNTALLDDLVSFEAYWPSGGLVSTVPDLLRLGHFVNQWSKGIKATKTVNLSNKTLTKLWTTVYDLGNTNTTIGGFEEKYSHGWFVGAFDKPIVCPRCKFSPIKQIMYHAGAITGVSTMLAIEPINDIVVVYFLNAHTQSSNSFMDILMTLFTNFTE